MQSYLSSILIRKLPECSLRFICPKKNKRRTMMKPLFAALSVAFLLGMTVSVHAAEQAKPTDRSVQVYKKADLAEWNRRPRRVQGNRLADPATGRIHRRTQTHRQRRRLHHRIGQRRVYRQHGQTDPGRRRRHYHRPPRSVSCAEKHRQRAVGLP